MGLTYIGRQPLFDRKLVAMGHELLYRAGQVDVAADTGDSATLRVVESALMEFGLDSLVGDGLAFINVPASFLEQGLHRVLPPDRVVLEVLPCPATPSTIEALERARVAGYQVALDGHDVDSPLVDHVDMVKIDVSGGDWDALGRAVNSLHDRRKRAVAKMVETYECLTRCRQLGFDLFQGFFFERPVLLSRRTITPDRMAATEFLLELHRDHADVGVLSEIVRRDAALTYRLFVVINSSYYAVRQRIENVRQAIVLLGIQTIRNFASLIALTQVEGKPSELVTTAMIRGRMCETLARRRHPGMEESAFLTGLLSVLDALMDAPLEEIVGRIALSEQVEAALLGRVGELGQLLEAVEAYERDDQEAVTESGLPPNEMMLAYVEAVEWALEVRAGLERSDEDAGLEPVASPVGA